MKKVITGFVVVTMAVGFWGCGGGAARRGPSLAPEARLETVQQEPDWYKNPEQKPGFIIGKGEATSASKVGARKKAISALLGDFAKKSKVIVEGKNEDYFKEHGEEYGSDIRQEFNEVQTAIWNSMITNWIEVKSETFVERSETPDGRKRNIYRTYILGHISRFEADAQLLEKIKRDEELLTAFEKTKAFEQLQKDLEKYREQFGM